MDKYVSYKAIKNLLEQTENDIAEVRGRIIDNLHHTEYDRVIIDDACMFNNLNATKYVLVQMLELCKEIKPSFDDLVKECNNQEQCKDCEEFVVYRNSFLTDCPKFGFCKKHEKFVNEYTECLDEEE